MATKYPIVLVHGVALKEKKHHGDIINKTYYTGAIDLREALEAAK